MNRKPLLFSASTQRALLEGGAVMALLMLPLVFLTGESPDILADAGAILAAFGGALVFNLRLAQAPGKFWNQIQTELGAAGAFSLLFLLLKTGLAFLSSQHGAYVFISLEPLAQFALVNFFDLALSLACSLGLRALAGIVMRWQQAGRRRFMWQVAGAFFLTVMLAFVLLLVIFQVFIPIGAPLSLGEAAFPVRIYADLLGRFITTVVISGAFLVGLAFLLPLVLPFSFFVARRLTRRISALARAAAVLRGGDLSARVRVDGQDELAELQQTFNQMAEQLQGTTTALQAERDKLSTALESQRRLTAGISHELRTPLAAVRGFTEASLETGPQAGELLQRNLETIASQAARMERILADLLALSQAQANALSIQLAPCNPAVTVERVRSTLAPLAWRQKKVEVSASLPEALPDILVDCGRLEQILNNLAQNAIRHSTPGGIVAFQAQATPAGVRIDVVDSGPGIPPSDLPHIWERFFQSADPEQRGAAGLGLALVKELSEAMGGQASVENHPGEGCRFSVEFPAA